MTLVELMIAIGVGSLVIMAAVSIWIFILRSFAAVGNYADLDSKSRFTVDSMLRDMRDATGVVDFQKASSNSWLTLTNSLNGTGVRYLWDGGARTLTRQKPGEADFVYLTECDSWDFQMYQRTPHTNGVYVFFPATNISGTIDASLCKVINMTWKCSRTILGNKMNTESVQTAQVVLRNKR